MISLILHIENLIPKGSMAAFFHSFKILFYTRHLHRSYVLMWYCEVNMDHIVFTHRYYGKRFKTSGPWIFLENIITYIF